MNLPQPHPAHQQTTSTYHFDVSSQRIELWKNTYCKGADDNELMQFVEICKRTGLSPETRQIYAIKRWDSQLGKNVMQTQTSIDGLRLIAERSREYAGQEGPYWCGEDGKWVDVWLSDKPPVAAKVGILRKDFNAVVWGVAKYSSYCPFNKSGAPSGLWAKMPDTMIAKCAEALGLRKAFPNDLSGLYSKDEMDQAYEAPRLESDSKSEPEPEPEAKPKPEPKPEPKPKPEARTNPKIINKNDQIWLAFLTNQLQQRGLDNIPRLIEVMHGKEWTAATLAEATDLVKFEAEVYKTF